MIGRLARGLGLTRESYSPPDTRRGSGAFYEPSALTNIAGERVTVETALSVPTVYACIRMLADTVGSTPLIVYGEATPGNRERLRDSPAWQVLHEEPNPTMSPVDLWTLVATWMVGWGDAFLGKQFASNGELVALWPIHPKDVTVRIEKGVRKFEIRMEGGREEFTDRDVIHVMGQSFDGIRGVSPISMARRELATAMAAQRYASAVYENTGVPRGALTFDRELSDEAMSQLRADWQRIYGGSRNAGRVAILEEGMKFQAISMPMRDVQFVEQQELSVQVIARIFRVPMSLIQAASPGGLTYSTAETENLQFLTHAVRPWYVRIEQALNRDLDVFPARPVEYTEFLPDALLRVATAERFAAYKVACGAAWMTVEEIRRAENLPKLEEDEELVTATPAPTAPAAEAPEAQPQETPVA